jgi:hypothetical protein
MAASERLSRRHSACLRSADLSASAHLASLCQGRPAQQEDDRDKDGHCDHRYHRVYEDNEHSQYGQNKTTGQNQQTELQRVDRNHSPYTLLIPYCTESGCPHRVVMPRSPVGTRQRPEGQRGGSGDSAGEHGGRLVVVHVASVAYRPAGRLARADPCYRSASSPRRVGTRSTPASDEYCTS